MITTHVLDTLRGKAGSEIAVVLFKVEKTLATEIASGITDSNGRLAITASDFNAVSGIYRLHFATSAYYAKQDIICLYPFVEITFNAQFPGHYHIPLILAPHGYSTYRGS